MKLFIAPHPDDESLWGSYILQRERPVVAVFRSDSMRVNDECVKALSIIDLKPFFIDSLENIKQEFETIYAPAPQGGHKKHDVVCMAAINKYGLRVRLYTSYGIDRNIPPFGRHKIEADAGMLAMKLKMLAEYKSQHLRSAVHFNLSSKDEYLL